MSEKRHRNQQRRQRRKGKQTVRSHPRPMSAERMMDELAKLAARSVMRVEDGLQAEQWASDLLATLLPPDKPVDPILVFDFIAALETLATPAALAALRALG